MVCGYAATAGGLLYCKINTYDKTENAFEKAVTIEIEGAAVLII